MGKEYVSESFFDADDGTLYRDAAGFPGYKVGADGSVWSCWKSYTPTRLAPPPPEERTWAKRKLTRNKKGYLVVSLHVNGVMKTVQVGRLVVLSFVGPCPAGMECCHNDGNPMNNTVGNLRWDTPVNNNKDRIAHGTHRQGERIELSVLKDQDVIDMRKMARDGRSNLEIAARHGADPTTVCRAVRGITWKHLPGAVVGDRRLGMDKDHTSKERTCPNCERRCKGPSYFLHKKACDNKRH